MHAYIYTLDYITLHNITLHYITLHYIHTYIHTYTYVCLYTAIISVQLPHGFPIQNITDRSGHPYLIYQVDRKITSG